MPRTACPPAARPPLLVVSARLTTPAGGDMRPRKDYDVLAQALGAEVLDYASVEQSASARLVARLAGLPTAQAWLAFVRRGRYSAVVTDGEHIGIPLALLLKLARTHLPHVTIGHRLTAAKKRPFLRLLRVHTHITRIVLHARRQLELAECVGIPAHKLVLLPYQVDTCFWQPRPDVSEERLVVSAGLEFRDYATLFRAVDGLDARVVIGASSFWSRRANGAHAADPPPNVEVGAFDYAALRDLYARASVVVVPLDDVDFQAGVTTILEAMAMGKPVVVTHTYGQTDLVEDRRRVTRGTLPRSRPFSFLYPLAEDLGLCVEPNGYYVLPGDAKTLRNAIQHLLDTPAERRQLGDAGRCLVEALCTTDQFAERMAAVVRDACSELAGESGAR